MDNGRYVIVIGALLFYLAVMLVAFAALDDSKRREKAARDAYREHMLTAYDREMK